VGTLLFVQNGVGFFSCTGTLLSPKVIPHPQYDDFSAFPQTFDVGLVILRKPVFSKTYGMLPTEGLLEDVLAEASNSSNWWTPVGYGMQGILNPFYQDDFARYQTTARLVELNSFDNGPGSSAKFTNNPGGGSGGTCFGDSGGPVFYQDTPIIGAVVSFGVTPCIGVDYQFRIDTPAALDFINKHLR
jgi:hypothetical protein